MKKDPNTLAHINLNAVLKNITNLYELDNEVKELIGKRNVSIQFLVKNGPAAVLRFENGKCEFFEGKHKNNVKLYFTSPTHFNNMVDGKANPIPLKGITKLGFLTNEFDKVTKKLEYYLKPTEELLKDAEYARINTILTFHTAFNALCQIANTDDVGKYTAKRVPNGNAFVKIGDKEKIYIKAENGVLKAFNGKPDVVKAQMEFVDYETANGMLNGNIDAYSCIGSKKLKLTGFIPLLDALNALLYQTSMYLKEDN